VEYGVFAHVGDVDELAASLRAAEADGLHSAWLTQGFGHDTLTAIAVAGRGLSRLRIGTTVVPVHPRHPMVLAQQSLTTNQLLGGRLVVGLGPSHPQVVQPCWGISYERPARYVREYVEAFTAALTQHVRFRGEVVTARGDLAVPGDTPAPAVMLAALGPQMLRVTGALADGTITWMAGPRTLRTLTVPTLSEAAQAADRPMPEVVVTAPVCVTRDPARARRDHAPTLRWYDGLPAYQAVLEREGVSSAVDLAVVGSEDEVLAAVEGYADAGASTFAAQAFGTPEEQAETLALLGRLARV
jgi:5,10-methylenetetrahydromethanopterin reductase